MRKILIIGPGGAGKTTLANRLGALLRLEVIHLDQLYWQPGWVEPAKADWQQRVQELTQRAAWVMDGNYSGTLAERMAGCDTVIFLDFARTVCLWRVLKRWAKYRKHTRPDMAADCPEYLSFAFLYWIWNYGSRSRPKIVTLLEANQAVKNVVWLRSPAEAEAFLREHTTLLAASSQSSNGGINNGKDD